ncbi:MAG: histidine phosphatase family protein [Clostridia bacterium]|nr:histidine phosphatase family protein [Clostridia bacterium]
MSKTTLIFVRHGYSETNEKNIFAGIYDAKLTEVGKQQASLTAVYLENYTIDKIYTSDLSRALHTAETIAARHGLSVIKNEQLREINLGEWEGVPFDTVVSNYPKEVALWSTDSESAYAPGGESMAQLSGRITTAVDAIVAENHGKTVCIVTHGEVLRTLFAKWTGERINNIPYVPNSSVTVVEYDDTGCRLVMDGYADHLGELATRLPILL